MVAVANIEVVMDGVVRDRDVARGIVNAIVAEMVDLIVRQYRVIAHEDCANAHIVDVGACDRDAGRIGHSVCAVAGRTVLSVAGAPLSNPLLLGPSIRAVSRADLQVLQDDVGGGMLRSLIPNGHQRLFVIVCAKQALHLDAIEHPFVGRSDVERQEHRRLSRRGLDGDETRVDDLLQVVADDDVTVIAAHQLDRVAGLDGRAPELVRNVNALAINDVKVGHARQQRASVASGELEREYTCQRVPGRSLRTSAARCRRLAVDWIEIPDLARGTGLSATRVNLSRPCVVAERGGKAKHADASKRARLFQSHGQPLIRFAQDESPRRMGCLYRNKWAKRKATPSRIGSASPIKAPFAPWTFSVPFRCRSREQTSTEPGPLPRARSGPLRRRDDTTAKVIGAP